MNAPDERDCDTTVSQIARQLRRWGLPDPHDERETFNGGLYLAAADAIEKQFLAKTTPTTPRMREIDNLTLDQLNEWTAKARGWVKRIDESNEYPDQYMYCDAKTGIWECDAENYTPTDNREQWAELLEEFKLTIKPPAMHNGNVTSWAALKQWPLAQTPLTGETPGIAICRAVVASVFGTKVEV